MKGNTIFLKAYFIAQSSVQKYRMLVDHELQNIEIGQTQGN